jgi:hypothetical protein
MNLVIKRHEKGKKTRYLSKNNNNILRLDFLLNEFHNARVIVPVREPLQHALSLLHQHMYFSGIQKNSKFTLNYMNWLGHHEFGFNQKPFFLKNKEIFNSLIHYDQSDVNYWLMNWLNYYNYIEENYSERIIIIPFEQLCENPTQVMEGLKKKIGIDYVFKDIQGFVPKSKRIEKYDEMIFLDCQTLYKKLVGHN